MNKCNNCAKFLTCDRRKCNQVTFLQAGQLERVEVKQLKIDIEYDADCREISISYETKISENSTSAMSLIKTLPYDAISDTLSAVVVNGVLTVTVEQNTSKSLTSDDSQTINIKRINQKQRGC